jgi:hypothetical protein
MQWLLDNWIIVLLVGGMIGMHLFGHGGHGGHGRSKHKPHDADTTDESGKTRPHSHANKGAVPGPATKDAKTADER